MKIISTLAIICILPFTLFSQNYLSNNVCWASYGSGYFSANGIELQTSYYWQYTNGDDSTIGNNTYYKLYSFEIDSFFAVTSTDSFLRTSTGPNGLAGLIRESGKQMFTVNRHGQDTLLWDFNLYVDGEIPNGYYTGCGPSYVDSIKNITFGTITRQVFYSHTIEYGGYEFGDTAANWAIIEGVGTYQGLFNNICGGIAYEGGSGLVCYSKDGNTFVFTPYYDTTYNLNPYFPPYAGFPCSPPSASAASVNNINAEERITVFPNPSLSYFRVQCTSNPNQKTFFRLYDAAGREVKRECIQMLSTIIPRGNLSNGIYFWEVVSNESILSRGKLVLN